METHFLAHGASGQRALDGYPTSTKVGIEAFILEHNEQRTPAQQNSREEQVLCNGCGGHPPPPPVCLGQTGSHDTWRHRRREEVVTLAGHPHFSKLPLDAEVEQNVDAHIMLLLSTISVCS